MTLNRTRNIQTAKHAWKTSQWKETHELWKESLSPFVYSWSIQFQMLCAPIINEVRVLWITKLTLWPLDPKAYVDVPLQLSNLRAHKVHNHRSRIRYWVASLTCPLTCGSPLRYHSVCGLMASPRTSFKRGSALRARTILRNTELDNFSWFVATVMNALQPAMPTTAANRKRGHLGCQRQRQTPNLTSI